MRAVQRAKHTRKPALRVDGDVALDVFDGQLAQVLVAERRNYSTRKSLEGFGRCCLQNSQILVSRISNCAVAEDAQRRCHLLTRR